MSLFSCLDDINDLKNKYPKLISYFNELEQQIINLDRTDQSHKLPSLVIDIKNKFPEVVALKYWSPALWLPIKNFYFPQKLTAIINELLECAKLSRQVKLSPICAFQLPSIQPPHFFNPKFKELYTKLHTQLHTFKNIQNAEYVHKHWLEFEAKTTLYKQNFNTENSSIWQRYQNQKYITLRQGIQNQMALAYMFHKNKQADINSQTDWHKGNDKQTGYGYVMVLAKPEFNPNLGQHTKYPMNKDINKFELNRKNKNQDQAIIKHNRITPLKIATTHNRAKALLEIAKQYHNQHLQIKLQSRIFAESYSYLQYQTTNQGKKIYFCEPQYGLFKFDNETDFLFFYEMLYAKQEMQNRSCWNRYQVSLMQHAPNQQKISSWHGKWRSLFYGLKYNNNLVDIVKGFVLFNLTLFVSVLAIYAVAASLAIISTSLSTLLFSLLESSGFSLILIASFSFATTGLLSIPDFCKVLWLTSLDNIKPLLGFKSHFDEILHKNFSPLNINAVVNTSHQHLIDALNVQPQQTVIHNHKKNNIRIIHNKVEISQPSEKDHHTENFII